MFDPGNIAQGQATFPNRQPVMTESEKQTRTYQLVMAADHYQQTGAISEVLLTCFDQRGAWVGTGVDLPDLHVSANLISTIIPREDLIRTNASGERVLYGTYFITSAKNYVVPFEHVCGDVIAYHYKIVEAPTLKTIGGSLIAMKAPKIRMLQLRTVWHHLLANSAVEFECPELLEVGGSLITRGADSFYKSNLAVGDRWLMHPDAHRKWYDREVRALLRRCAGPEIEI